MDSKSAAIFGQCVAMRNVLNGIIASLEEEESNDEPVSEQPKHEGGTMGSLNPTPEGAQ